MTNKDLMTRRIDAYELQCDVADVKEQETWPDGTGYVNVPTRRLRELLELARVGLEHAP
jgi:hypothetical protein